MEASGLSGGLMPGMGSGMLGLEIPLHHPQHSNNPLRQHHQLYQNHHHQFMPFTSNEAEGHNNQSQQSVKPNAYPNTLKGKQQQGVLSDEEVEPVCAATDDGGGGGDGRKRVSPWQRVKWTDSMIRLLIMVVFYIEDDSSGGGQEVNDPSGGNCKKKSGGILQKKGKWKSVSRAMMDKGFFVSPQQCEDKFNDLNKRYKRVNEILGKGTACRVVENQSLLETMDHLSPKMKEEARKLLNSKHLFFREMCAYHNSGGGGGGGGGGGAHQSSEAVLEPSSHYQSQQRCSHSTNGAGISNSTWSKMEAEGFRVVKGRSQGEDDDDGANDDDDGEEDDEDEDSDDDGDEIHCGGGGGGGRITNEHSGGHEDEDENEKFSSKKRRRKGMCSSSSSTSPLVHQLSCELMGVLQDGTKSPLEQRQWMRSRWMQLEEQQVSYRLQAYELEKQRLKWIKFSGKKEREMERMKLKNERMRLENERMVLLLRQKEFELLDFQRQQQDSSKRPEPSLTTG